MGVERSTIAIWAAAAVLAVVAAWRLLGGTGEAPPVRVDGAGAAGRSGAATGSRSLRPPRGADAAPVYVHVVGAVRRPGLLRLPGGARVATALERAGGAGPRADLTLVNLAAPVEDGQQIVVPLRGRAGAAAAGGGSAAAVPAPIRLSSATIEQLEEIDGIGPTLAGRIIEYRDANGVTAVEELAEVDGIGEQRLATLREALQP